MPSDSPVSKDPNLLEEDVIHVNDSGSVFYQSRGSQVFDDPVQSITNWRTKEGRWRTTIVHPDGSEEVRLWEPIPPENRAGHSPSRNGSPEPSRCGENYNGELTGGVNTYINTTVTARLPKSMSKRGRKSRRFNAMPPPESNPTWLGHTSEEVENLYQTRPQSKVHYSVNQENHRGRPQKSNARNKSRYPAPPQSFPAVGLPSSANASHTSSDGNPFRAPQAQAELSSNSTPGRDHHSKSFPAAAGLPSSANVPYTLGDKNPYRARLAQAGPLSNPTPRRDHHYNSFPASGLPSSVNAPHTSSYGNPYRAHIAQPEPSSNPSPGRGFQNGPIFNGTVHGIITLVIKPGGRYDKWWASGSDIENQGGALRLPGGGDVYGRAEGGIQVVCDGVVRTFDPQGRRVS